MKKRFIYCLRLLVALALVCNVNGVFATTISTNTTLSSATTYSGDVTVNPGVTLTISSEVTINGNLINNGGTIIVGEGGVLTVDGDVTNTSDNTSYNSSTKYYRNGGEATKSNYEKKPNTSPSATTRSQITIIEYNIGLIEVSNGGSLNTNGNVENNGANLTITSVDATKLSRIIINGTFTNSENVFSVRTESQIADKKKSGKNEWESDHDNTYSDKIIESVASTINLSNGYLVVKGSMELQDNSVINYNIASSLGEDIQSTINVSGNVVQAENADINLASGAKGQLIVAETYTDNTTTDGDANHPWSITDDGEFVVNSGFDLYAKKYVSAKIDSKEDEIDALIASLNAQISELTGKTLDEYMQLAHPDEYEKYKNNSGIPKKNLLAGWRKYSTYYTSFGEYFRYEASTSWGEFLASWGSAVPTEEQYNTAAGAERAAAVAILQAELEENTALKETFEELIRVLEEKGVKSLDIESQSASVYALLPIELTSFTVSANEYAYTFNWVTASEDNNDYFTLEYSIDGVDFSEIDYVHGAGTTSETSEYEYVWNAKPTADILYFRLKQTDYNGEYTYSDVIVSCRKKSAGATRTFRYGPLNLQVVDGELRYIENK
ncbi:MAG: hypothetical protein J6W37_02740 [Bacteroidales bacterium]|nr:hypothetical protein [Bacteroidales bacterium]